MPAKKKSRESRDSRYSNAYPSKNSQGNYSDFPPSSEDYYYQHGGSDRTPTRAQLAAYDNYAFSNAGYAIPTSHASSYDHYYKMPFTEDSSRKSRYTITDQTSSSGTDSSGSANRQRSLRIKVIIAVLVLLVFVAVAIGIAVYFSTRQMSDDNERVVGTTTTEPVIREPKVEVSLRVTNREYTTDLADPNSNTYKIAKQEYEALMDSSLSNSSSLNGTFSHSEVTGFQRGSVIVLYIIVLKFDSRPNRPKPKPEEVDFFEKIVKNPVIIMNAVKEGIEQQIKANKTSIKVDIAAIFVKVTKTSPGTITTAPHTTTTVSQTTEPATTRSSEVTTASSSSEASTTAPETTTTTLSEVSTSSETTMSSTTSVPSTETTTASSTQTSTTTTAATTAVSPAETTASSEATSVLTETTTVSSEAALTSTLTVPTTTTTTADTTVASSEGTTTVSKTTEMPTTVSSQKSTTEAETSTTTTTVGMTSFSASSSEPTTVEVTTTTMMTDKSDNVTTVTTERYANASMTTMTTEQLVNTSTTMTPGQPGNASSTTFEATPASTSVSSPSDANMTTSAFNATHPYTTEPSTTVVRENITTTSGTTESPADRNVTAALFTVMLTLADSVWQDELFNISSAAFQQMAKSVKSEIDAIMNMSDAAHVYNEFRIVGFYPGSVLVEAIIFLKDRSSLTSAQQLAIYEQLHRDNGTEMIQYYFKQGMDRFKKENVPALEFSKIQFYWKKVGCPDWADVHTVMSDNCTMTYDRMMSATSDQEACLYYANTVKCAAFLLRTQQRICSVVQIHQRMHKDNVFMSQQAGGIDLRKVCEVSSLKFTTDIDSTPLCENTDALIYIALYVATVTGDGSNMGSEGHSGMGTTHGQGYSPPGGGFGSGNHFPKTTGSWHAGQQSTWTTVPTNQTSNHTGWFPGTTYPYPTPPSNHSSNHTGWFPGTTYPYPTPPTNHSSNYTGWFPGTHTTSPTNHSSNHTGWFSGTMYPYTTPPTNHSSNHTRWFPGTMYPFTTPPGNYSLNHTRWFPGTMYPFTTPPGNYSSNHTRWFPGTMYPYTTVPPSFSTDGRHHYPSNPCLAAMKRASHVLSVLANLGLHCESQNVSYLLMEQDLSATPQIYQEVKQCSDYMKKLEKGPDKCFNMSDFNMQKSCYGGYMPFFNPAVVTGSQACSALEELVRCSSWVSGCSEKDSRRGIMEYLSFMVSVKNILHFSIPGVNMHNMFKTFSCDLGGGGLGTTYPTYPTTSRRPDLKTEHIFSLHLRLNKTWHPSMSNPASYTFRQTAKNITEMVDEIFGRSDLRPIYAFSETQSLLYGNMSVRAYVWIYIYIDLNPKYNDMYIALRDGTTNYITEQFSKGFQQFPWLRSVISMINFTKPSDEQSLYVCPEWSILWQSVNDTCATSLKAFKSATSKKAVCEHYGAYLKCASLVARIRHYQCDLQQVKAMAFNDTWVFTYQVKGYNPRELCYDKDIQLLADIKTPACDSPDVYMYIADYVCIGYHPSTPFTQYPYHTSKYPYGSTPSSPGYWNPWKTASYQTGYWTTSKYPHGSSSSSSGYWNTGKTASGQTGYWTTSKYPYGSSSSSSGYWTTSQKSSPNPTGSWMTKSSGWPSSSQPGYWTTTKPPSGYTTYTTPTNWHTTYSHGPKTYRTTPKYPSYPTHPTYHWTSKMTYPWKTTTTSMPPEEIPCSGFIYKAQCIQQTMQYLRKSCPMEKVYSVLIQYNQTLLTKETSECEEDSQKILKDDCFSQDAVTNCTWDMYMLFTEYVPEDVCGYWYGRAMVCISRNMDTKKCPLQAVDKVWRRYLRLLLSLRHSNANLGNINVPLVEKVLRCPANDSNYGKRECPSFPDLLSFSEGRCFPIYASLRVRNSSTASNCTTPGVVLSDTAHKPRTLQQRCKLYRDLIQCLALSMKDEYECDSRDLHEKAQEQSANVFTLFGFYTNQCKDYVPDKYRGPKDICKSPDLYQLLTNYYCNHSTRVFAKEKMNLTDCMDFYNGVSCLTREASRMVRHKTCSEEDVVSVLMASVNSTTTNSTGDNSTMVNSTKAAYSSCLHRTLLISRRGQVVLRQQGKWASVCPWGWGQEEAQVTCRQLGFQYGHAFNRSGSSYIGSIGPIQAVYSHFECVGNESSLMECGRSSQAWCSMYGQLAAVLCSSVEVKYELVPDKPGLNYGYVNHTRDEGTGLMCAPILSDDVAASICHAAGYENGGMAYPFSLNPPPGIDRVWRSYLYCSDSSQDIEGCASNWRFGPATWVNNSDGMIMGYSCDGSGGNLVKVFCFDKPVRLDSGLFNSSGIPVIMKPGEKSAPRGYPFCQEGFDNVAADLFCEQIGFEKGGVSLSFHPFRNVHYSQQYYVNCTGQEKLFTSCRIYSGYYCSDVAVVRCNHDPEPGVNNLDTRLQIYQYGSPRRRVLVYYNGEWGTICATTWTDREANVVCKSQGYEGGTAARANQGQYLAHLIYNVTCEGNDSRLADCRFSELDSNVCRYSEGAAVVCFNKEDLAEYRLVGGPDNSSGYVIVTINNTQGLLCASQMGAMHYNILCRELGFTTGERDHTETPIPATGLGWGWGTSFSYDCGQNASSLESCRENRWYKSYGLPQADNVTASPKPYCYHGFAQAFCYRSAVRLNSGFRNKTGVLQLYTEGRYKDICQEQLTQAALNTLCQQATGMPKARAMPLPPQLLVGLKHSWGVNLNSSCLESGQAVESCVEKSTYCGGRFLTGRHYVAAVTCYEDALTDDITSWKITREGRIMVKKYGTDGTVCRDSFNDTVADLFCKSQGYLGGYRGTTPFMYTDGLVPMWVDTVSCPVNAKKFSDCTVVPSTNGTQCFSLAAASVHCYARESYINLYLANTYFTNTTVTGRVMVDKDNRTGYLCRGWKIDDMFATALCKMMNYTNGGFVAKDESMIPELDWSRPAAWSANLHCASGSPKLDVMRCLTSWERKSLITSSAGNCHPQQQKSECSKNVATVTCYRSTEKPGKCPPLYGYGIGIHQCSNDFECDNMKKCCSVGSGFGRICTKPVSDETTPVPTPAWTTTDSSHSSCPSWAMILHYVSPICMTSLDFARYSHYNKCRHYASFLKCASFILRIKEYRCSEKDLRQIAYKHYWYFATSPFGTTTSGYYGSESSWIGSDYGASTWGSSGSSDYYGSGGSQWDSSGSSSFHGSSGYTSGVYGSSDYYGSGSGGYSSGSGSSGYYGSGSSGFSSGSGSSGYYGSGSSGYSSGSGYYGSGSGSSGYYGSGSDGFSSGSGSSGYYGSGSGGYSSGIYSSSDYYGSGSGGYSSGSDSSGYYGSGSDGYSSSSGYYGSGSGGYSSGSGSSDYHGSGGASWDSSGSSSYYGSGSSSSDYGSSGSSWDYSGYHGSGGSSWDGSGSSSYTGSSQLPWSGHYGSGGSSGASLPAICKNYELPSLVDMEKTEPCANPDVFLYIIEYHCQDAYTTTTPPYYGHSSSSYHGSSTGSYSASWSDSWSPYNPSSTHSSQHGTSTGTYSPWSDSWSSNPSSTHASQHGSSSGSYPDSWSHSWSSYNPSSTPSSSSGSYPPWSDNWSSNPSSTYTPSSQHGSSSGSYSPWSGSWSSYNPSSTYTPSSQHGSSSGSYPPWSDNWSSNPSSTFTPSSQHGSSSGSYSPWSDNWSSNPSSTYTSSSQHGSFSGSYSPWSDSWSSYNPSSTYTPSSQYGSSSGSYSSWSDSWSSFNPSSTYTPSSQHGSSSGSYSPWSDSWSPYNPSSTHSSQHGYSTGYTSGPYYTTAQPYYAPDNACRALSKKVQCIHQKLADVGRMCPISTMYNTIKMFNRSVLTTEFNMCNGFVKHLEKDSCFQEIIRDKSDCLRHLNNIPVYGNPCGKFNAAMQCSMLKYPGQCRRNNTGQILRQWLSAKEMMNNLSFSHGISINEYSLEHIFRCPYPQIKKGCPSFQEMAGMLGRGFTMVARKTNLSSNASPEKVCRLFEDVLTAADLITAEYTNCTSKQLLQLFLANDGAVKAMTNFSISHCAGNVTLPQINKTKDVCQNSYFIKLLADGKEPCGYANLSAPVNASDAYKRVSDALICYFRNADALVPPSMRCRRESIIRGLKANPQYLHPSYVKFLDANTTLNSNNMVMMRDGDQWAMVCGNDWNDTDATVFCRSLGYNVAFSFKQSNYGYYNGDVFGPLEKPITDMKCSGHENSLLNCSYGRGPCTSNEVAGARCYMSAPVYELVSGNGQKNGNSTHRRRRMTATEKLPDAPYGYIKRTEGGRSAFVTTSWVEEKAVDMLCKAAGYSHGGRPFPFPLPDIDMGNFFWNAYFSCYEYGVDVTIDHCAARSGWWIVSSRIVHEFSNGSYTYIQSNYHKPVKVFCYHSGVRLHNSLLNSTGIAEVRYGTHLEKSPYSKEPFLAVCRDGFTNFTASLFCKALGLGFQSGMALSYQPFRFYYGHDKYFNVSCNGTETEFHECQNGTVYRKDCSSGLAVVSCMPSLDASDEAVPDMTVKLDHDNEKVLFYRNGQWGYICNDRWTDVEADKVCKNLGFDLGIAKRTYIGTTFRPFLIHNVTCDGAKDFKSCGYQTVESDICNNYGPAMVSCFNQSDVAIYSLYNGKDAKPNYGWVHVTRQHTEGRLCAAVNPERFYGVLCRHLGFIDGEEYRGDPSERTTLPFWSTDYGDCRKDGQNPEACRKQGWGKGQQQYDYTMLPNGTSVPVSRPYCYGAQKVKAFCYNKTVRVHSGYYNTSGVVQLAVNQTYQLVCALTNTYSQSAADVLCHSLTNSTTSSAIRVRRNVFMYNARPTVHVNFSCNGTETDVDQCLTVRYTDTSSDCKYDEKMVALVCYEGQKPDGNITQWKIGQQDSVLVLRLGLWGHVCSASWTHNEAAAVCRTLGYYSGVSMSANAWGLKAAQWVDTMTCPPGAANVSQCSIQLRDYTLPQGQDYTSCHARRAKCFHEADVPDIFLVDNQTQSSSHLAQGRVAIRYRGTTGYFCSFTVTKPESYSTMCRLLGYPRGGEKLNLTSNPLPTIYMKSWSGQMTCGQWDRNIHPVSCIKDLELKDTYQHGFSSISYSTLSQDCGRYIPAISCFESGDYRLVGVPNSKTRGLLVIWNNKTQDWEQICRSGFNGTEVNATCRQLGFSEGGQMIPEGSKPERYYARSQLRFQCSGVAGETLSECDPSPTYCSESEPSVWLKCGTT